MNDLVILDFETAQVHYFKVPTNENVVDFMASKGFKETSCHWMTAEYIYTHKHYE